MNVKYSFIVPVYNRPNEIKELLESFLVMQVSSTYEIVIVEDGSTISSEEVISEYASKLNILYLKKQNTGPGDSRNYGMQSANGSFFLILDSDVVMPPHYLVAVDAYLDQNQVDCFGGPDAAEENFSAIQKAINFTMTSFLTTGGIRGKEKSVKSYEPRSFNMGISKKAFQKTKGFGKIHPGEDPDLSIRIKKAGYQIGFIKEAYVYHKRRIDWQKFYVQVNKFGKVRPILNAWHPETSSVVFWLPSLFSLGLVVSLALVFFQIYVGVTVYAFYLLLIFIGSSIENKSLLIGILSLRATLTQFLGYGFGFLKSTYYIRIRSKDPKKVFPELFFN
ncbi:glycosyltransferase [Mesonia mobilis]|uniref:Glycosyl transferase family 2 n=1 Tax=Mesonia mobilis TaxID=369791 RepID=A0ABQ3C276_9FLAO|nr:glycosyltransferase [Mesonia mobilis]MBQ0737191.1 glycosyltransferase [Aquimarina celericrescens]GGZ62295.1 glycosyl transferase family 2 [Mesonia mobilis]